MKFLLFLLGISYFFIFFFLSHTWVDSFLLPLFLQAQIYVAGAIFFILYTLEVKKTQWEKKYFFSHFRLNLLSLSQFIKHTLKENLYTFWIILLYTSVYFISHWFFEGISFPYIFALGNIAVIILYFIFFRSQLLYDIIRWNTILTSLFYSVSHVFLLLWLIDMNFQLIDYLNLWVVSILFIVLFSSERSKKNAWIFATHALVFFLLEISILFYFTIPPEFFLQSIIAVLSWVIHLFFYGLDQLQRKTYISTHFFLGFWKILSFILISLWWIMLLWEVSIYLFPAFLLIFLHAYYLIRYYLVFREIWSLFFSSFWFLIFLSFCIISLYGEEFFLLYSPFIAMWISVFVYFLPLVKKYILLRDIYIIHIFLLWVNVFWVLLFFIYREFSILQLWFLLLFEAMYFISNSYIFKKLYPWK